MPGVSFAEHVVFFDVQMQMRRYKRDTLSIFLRPTKRGGGKEQRGHKSGYERFRC